MIQVTAVYGKTIAEFDEDELRWMVKSCDFFQLRLGAQGFSKDL